MNNIIRRTWKQGGMVNIEDLRGTAFQDEEQGHTFRIRGVSAGGADMALSGSVGAVFLRADHTDVAIPGTIEDGAAVITLPAECYDMPGRFGLTVYLTSEGQTAAIYAAIGSVSRTSSGNVSPGTAADVADLINAINAAIASIPQDYQALENSVSALRKDFSAAAGEFYKAEGKTITSTTNLYCDKDISLSPGDRVRVTVLSWDQPASNRASITVYAKASTNYRLGGIPAGTPIPSNTYEYEIPEGTYTGIRVNLKSSSAVLGATGSVLIEKIGWSYIGKRFGEIGSAFDVTGTSSASTYIYCDKKYPITGGSKIAVKPVYWSSQKRQSIKVYIYDGTDYTSIGDIPVPYSDRFYIFTIPAGNYELIRVAFKNTELDGTTECRVVIADAAEGTFAKAFVDSSNASELSGIKINCLGDSLTYGYVPSGSGSSPMSPTWCEQLAADLQCTVRNYGITNNAVSNNSGGTGDPMCIRYTTMDDDADAVIVMGGTNDFLRVNAPLGTIDSTDITTFYGAYNTLVQGLIAKYLTRKARIILMVPPMRNRSTEQNAQGVTLMQIQQAVRDIAHKYALPVVDWAYDAGISAYLISTDTNHIYTYDGIHIQKEIILSWILPLIERKVTEAIRK